MNVNLALASRRAVTPPLRVLNYGGRQTWARLAGLGADSGACQIPKPGNVMIFPPCPGYDTDAGPGEVVKEVSGGGGWESNAPAVYVAPTDYETPINCLDGNPYGPWTACVNENLKIQTRNQARSDAANRDVFVANCKSAVRQNNEQRSGLNLPLLADDCDYKGYGQTLPGTTGGTSDYLPGTPQYLVDQKNSAVKLAPVASPSPSPSPSPAKPPASQTSPAPPPKPKTTADRIADGYSSNDGALDDSAPGDDDDAAGSSSAALWIGGLIAAGVVFMAVKQ